MTEPITVLVVDDEDGIRNALERFLKRLGYRVLLAADAAQALAALAKDKPTALLSDIRMPNMSGVELVPKALAVDPDVAIIMLTAIDEPRTAIECLKLGAYDYLIKPVDLDELELSLQGALRARQLEIERRELEQWLAKEVAVRTAELEEKTTAIEEIALTALADLPDPEELVRRLAVEIGVPEAEVAAEVQKRRGKR
jgi:cyclic di-GMP phosphodiesterase